MTELARGTRARRGRIGLGTATAALLSTTLIAGCSSSPDSSRVGLNGEASRNLNDEARAAFTGMYLFLDQKLAQAQAATANDVRVIANESGGNVVLHLSDAAGVRDVSLKQNPTEQGLDLRFDYKGAGEVASITLRTPDTTTVDLTNGKLRKIINNPLNHVTEFAYTGTDGDDTNNDFDASTVVTPHEATINYRENYTGKIIRSLGAFAAFAKTQLGHINGAAS